MTKGLSVRERRDLRAAYIFVLNTALKRIPSELRKKVLFAEKHAAQPAEYRLLMPMEVRHDLRVAFAFMRKAYQYSIYFLDSMSSSAHVHYGEVPQSSCGIEGSL